MKQFYFGFFFVSFLIFVGCHPAKKIQAPLETKRDTVQPQKPVVAQQDSGADSLALINSIYQKVKSRRIEFETFSAKIKVEYSDKSGKGPDLTVFARIKKDSVIWLSINATVFSYEAFRVLITKDSVIVLNKKDKIAQLRSISFLQELTQLPFDFFTIQDLIIGNPVYLEKDISSFKQNNNQVTMLLTGEKFKNLLTLLAPDYLVQHSKLEDVTPSRNRTSDLSYSNYESKNGIFFPVVREINVSDKSKLDIDMDFKQYSFNENLSFPMAIPKGYKRN